MLWVGIPGFAPFVLFTSYSLVKINLLLCAFILLLPVLFMLLTCLLVYYSETFMWSIPVSVYMMLVTSSCRPSVNKNQNAVLKSNSPSLLEKTCELLRNFPEYLDVVVSVARKTDGRHWADLFSAAGRSTEYVFSTSSNK